MVGLAFFVLFISYEPLLRGFHRLLDRLVGVPHPPAKPEPENPMEGARRVMVLLYAMAVGGLSLIFFPKPILPYLDGLSVYALCLLFLPLDMLAIFYDRLRCVRGAPAKRIPDIELWLIFAFVILSIRALVVNPHVI